MQRALVRRPGQPLMRARERSLRLDIAPHKDFSRGASAARIHAWEASSGAVERVRFWHLHNRLHEERGASRRVVVVGVVAPLIQERAEAAGALKGELSFRARGWRRWWRRRERQRRGGWRGPHGRGERRQRRRRRGWWGRRKGRRWRRRVPLKEEEDCRSQEGEGGGDDHPEPPRGGCGRRLRRRGRRGRGRRDGHGRRLARAQFGVGAHFVRAQIVVRAHLVQGASTLEAARPCTPSAPRRTWVLASANARRARQSATRPGILGEGRESAMRGERPKESRAGGAVGRAESQSGPGRCLFGVSFGRVCPRKCYFWT